MDSVIISLEGRVRKIQLDDLQNIRRLVLSSGVFSESETHDAMNMIEHYAKFPEGDELLTYVYVIRKEIAGFISFGLGLGNKTYELYWICVSPCYQGNGIGTNLLKFAEEYVSNVGGRILFIETSSSEKYTRARMFYEQRGYLPSAVIANYFDDGDDKLIYSKRIYDRNMKYFET